MNWPAVVSKLQSSAAMYDTHDITSARVLVSIAGALQYGLDVEELARAKDKLFVVEELAIWLYDNFDMALSREWKDLPDHTIKHWREMAALSLPELRAILLATKRSEPPATQSTEGLDDQSYFQ